MKAPLPPAWLDQAAYPFESHYFDAPSGDRLHYVDEGPEDAPALVFVHGTPSWSFEYRDLVKGLRGRYRCLALDALGFGLSDKPRDADYTPAAQGRRLEAWLDRLGLDGVTLVVHDFGGPFGLSWALRHPERVGRLVLMNTWLWRTDDDPAARRFGKLLAGPVGRFLYLDLNFSPRVLLKKGFVNRTYWSKTLHAHYLKPFPRRDDRRGLLGTARALVGASAWYALRWTEIGRLAEVPTLLLWGTRDPFFGPDALARWQAALPRARTVELDCGHFPAEERPAEVLSALEDWLAADGQARRRRG
ncbi:MAG: alpha/beta fold hydrolase [Catalinimonas sp.]